LKATKFPMKQQTLLVMIAMIIVILFACSASAWNTSTHMVTGAIAYRILENESPRTVSVIKTLLEKHPWYADRWRDDVEKGKFVNAKYFDDHEYG
jgi:hypothetical protein